MQEELAQHLIVGAGLLGLATADQLLRRGAESVAIMEAGSSPQGTGLGDSGASVRTGLAAYSAIESRAQVLLEGWADYLEVDPGYTRPGCYHVQLPLSSSQVDSQEPMSDSSACAWTLPNDGRSEYVGLEEVNRRQSILKLSNGLGAEFFGRDGWVDPTDLLSALHWQVRKRQGRILFDREIESVELLEDSLFVRAGRSSGRVSNLYLTGKACDQKILHQLHMPREAQLRTYYHFQFSSNNQQAGIVRIEFEIEEEMDESASSLLELDSLEEASAEKRTALLADNGKGCLDLWLEGDRTRQGQNDTVDWKLLDRFRNRFHSIIPSLGEGRIKRGSTFKSFELDKEAKILTHPSGRIHASGAFGCFGVLLSLGVAEELALSSR